MRKYATKHGKHAAKRQFSQYKPMFYPELPLKLVEIDYTRLDIIVIDDQDDLPHRTRIGLRKSGGRVTGR